MITRRTVLGVGIALPVFAPLSDASAQPYDANGLDRRTLANVEEKWMKSRFLLDQWMETGRLKKSDAWPRTKASIVRGSFSIGYHETGKAEVIENGVRTGKIAEP